MPTKRLDEQRLTLAASQPTLRIMLKRLREIMSEPGDGQARLNRIVGQISVLMVAEVCSIYLRRADGSLELFATEGLNSAAVHTTFMQRGEGLVGRCAETGQAINEPDAQSHPSFSYRPETGEEIFHSFLAVPIQRGGGAAAAGGVLGVLTIQNRQRREYSDDDIEVLETTAMVLAEHIVTGDVAGTVAAPDYSRAVSHIVRGQPISEGIALGHIVMHASRVVVTELNADDPAAETRRLESAVEELKSTLDEFLEHGDFAGQGEHREVLETYRMFAHDRGWLKRMKDAIQRGLTAEAAVERVQNDTRARLASAPDSYLRDRLQDLDELSNRLLRLLSGRAGIRSLTSQLPPDTVLVARGMGPADLLDYDRTRIKGLVVEDSSGQSHIAIVAKALGIAAVGQARGVMDRADEGDPIIVDAETGEIHIRPTSEVIAAYADKARFRARRQRKFRTMADVPSVTKDGTRISLNMNAGLLVDLPHLHESHADGIGLFRTELQFMVSRTLPRLDRQTQIYRSVLDEAKGKPVIFRTLDIGGDKALPYLRQPQEENPALGWRAIRMALDRKALLLTQVGALLRAASGRDLSIMLPMITTADEIVQAKTVIERAQEGLRRKGIEEPRTFRIGVMIEVPAILYDLDRILPMVDFASVGSNDLLQYLFAADRNNDRVSTRYDPLLPPALRVFQTLVAAAARHDRSLTLCGEIGGRPLEAMALIGLGLRSFSMAPSALGPIKSMVLALDGQALGAQLAGWIDMGANDIRERLKAFATEARIEL